MIGLLAYLYLQDSGDILHPRFATQAMASKVCCDSGLVCLIGGLHS